MGHQLQTGPSKSTTGMSKICSRIKVKCYSKSCHSCAGRVVADCVAVSCCPCAVVNIFTLAFVKVPWMVGKKCLGNENKKKKLMKHEDKNGSSRSDQGEKVGSIKLGSFKYSARFEAERVWLEMYKFDHSGFGRVSFNGIQSLDL